MAAKEQVDLDLRDIQGRSLEEMGLHYRTRRAELTQVVLEARQRRRWGEFIIHQSE